MTSIVKKIVLLCATIAFTNTVSAQNWPIFSTQDLNQDYIKINHDPLLNAESKFYDNLYRYDLDLNKRNIHFLNILIICNKADVKLMPQDKESIEDKTIYTVYINDTELEKIEIKRKRH
ncbi:MAG: hypothetical protein Q8S31_03920 [Alphaproteobacteria bacterium]|nr:hypothetical protein [Alphaproteobacteria bacterium]